MTFIRYQHQNSIAENPAPVVSIGAGHRISVNRAALRRMGANLDEPYILLLFDPVMGHIGIMAPRDIHDYIDAVRLSPREKAPSAQVTRFARQMGIDWNAAHGRYPLTYDESLRLWLVDLPRGSWRRGEADIAPVTALKRRAS